MSVRRLWAGCALLLAVAASGAIAAGPASASTGTGTVHRFAPGPSSGAGFWTAERISRAPERSLTIDRGPVAAPRGLPDPGPPTRVGGQRPLRSLATSSAAFAVADAAAYPYRTHGKLFGRIGGGLYSCSATSISTRSRSVVLTAAHCLRDPGAYGQWARNVIFVPAYGDGARPFGTFQAKWGQVLRGYTAYNPKFDVGVFVTAASGAGRLGNVVGSRGWATGLSRDQAWQIFGYPANISNAGRMQECDSGWLGNDLFTEGWPGPWTLRVDCNMGHGASGGGWVTADGYLNGVIDYGYESQPDRIYGAYFGRAVRRLIQQMP